MTIPDAMKLRLRQDTAAWIRSTKPSERTPDMEKWLRDAEENGILDPPASPDGVIRAW